MTEMTYELWHTGSGNFLEDFESEEEALAAIRDYLRANGPDMVDDLALGAVPSTGLTGSAETPPFLRGAELLARIEAALPTAPKTTNGAGVSLDRSPLPGTRHEPRETTVSERSDAGKAAR